MPTHRTKLFSLLMGSSTPTDVAAADSNMTTPAANNDQSDPSIETPTVTAEPTNSSLYSINLDRLRRIFQALSSLNQNKATEAEVGEEPLQMRRKYLGIFERFERRFGTKASADSNGLKRKTLPSRKDRILAFIKRNTDIEEHDETKNKTNWARDNLNRLTSSMRQVKSDSFLSKRRRRSKRLRREKESADQEQIRLPSMKTKKRSTKARSKALINSASQTAHTDLVKHLQENNSSQHCLNEIDFWNYDYPFENLVFEGGGAKVHTYIGAIKVCDYR